MLSAPAEEAAEEVRKAEAERVIVENARKEAEKSRETAETKRASSESTRASAETTRINAEKERVTAEGLRKTAETEREMCIRDRYETVSQDTGEEISGRATAIYESSEGIRTEAAITNSWLAMIYSAMGNQGIRQSGLPAFIPASISTLQMCIRDSKRIFKAGRIQPIKILSYCTVSYTHLSSLES